MSENTNQPKEYDAVLGGQNPPINAAVLGGIEGVKKRFASSILEERIKALSDALKYREKGLDLVLQALQDESTQVKVAAYSLLKQRQETQVKQQVNLLPEFEFEVVTVDTTGNINSRCCHRARFFIEDLGNGIFLEMVAIPGGTFLMGSSKTEKYRDSNESPQHQVTIKPFFMGKYTVTQAQWTAVAALPKINVFLDSEPSRFTGENRPVERVSWHEAQEFCARLSQKTGTIYRLPSEAEWEYACRARTTTPFHFGETITTDLANYFGERTYGNQPKGIDRGGTTPVGSFPPNAFGLYEMHGNVWEFCTDPWHDNYNDVPNDGSVWEYSTYISYRLQRGGSWSVHPRSCRSASRRRNNPDLSRDNDFGFRIVSDCSAWTY